MNARPGTEPEHEELQLLLGAFVLGGLDPAEHQAFSRHLRTCAVCQREAAQLSGLPALLDLVEPGAEPEETDGELPTPDGAVPAETVAPVALLDRVRAARRRRRWGLGAVAAALIVVAGAIGASIGPVMAAVNAPPTRGLVAAAAPVVDGQSAPAQVEIDLVTRNWGTQLDVRGSGLPTGQVLFLAVTDREGHQYDVASWTGTASGRTTLTAACWMKPGDIVQLQVHTRDGTPVATATA
ncbi:MAG TPA: zf-HC2 domain-containing protein [Actinomycetes bacterium]|nr:zf-HC2 domain-containing protein [Actinomycetes bacterium]